MSGYVMGEVTTKFQPDARRDFFAGLAMMELMKRDGVSYLVAEQAYKMADFMIRAEGERYDKNGSRK